MSVNTALCVDGPWTGRMADSEIHILEVPILPVITKICFDPEASSLDGPSSLKVFRYCLFTIGTPAYYRFKVWVPEDWMGSGCLERVLRWLLETAHSYFELLEQQGNPTT